MNFELASFQVLTPGLYSGDPIRVFVNFQIESHGFLRHLGWGICIRATLDGQYASYGIGYAGNRGGEDNLELVFTGNMPSGKELKGKITFGGFYYLYTPWRTTFNPDTVYDDVQFAECTITIPNLDDVPPPEPPNGEPPAVCTEGQERCEGFDLYVCQNNQWKVKEYNSSECGYTPEPICTNGDERCKGTDLQVCVGDHWEIRERNSSRCGYVPPDEDLPVPPTDEEEDGGIGGWFDRNKTAIIIGSAVALAIALVILFTKKLKFQKPVTGIKSPIARRPK